MPLRKPAARKIVRLLLEKRLSRAIVLSDEFEGVMADMVMTYVDMDETAARNEGKLIVNPSNAAKESK